MASLCMAAACMAAPSATLWPWPPSWLCLPGGLGWPRIGVGLGRIASALAETKCDLLPLHPARLPGRSRSPRPPRAAPIILSAHAPAPAPRQRTRVMKGRRPRVSMHGVDP
eukprot:360958-Chlamydomonas_euryale.AAC.14